MIQLLLLAALATNPVAERSASPDLLPAASASSDKARRRHAAPVLIAVANANQRATAEPRTSAFAGAVQIFPFSAGTVYRVYAAPGIVTDVALEPGERLIAVAAGDTARWIIGDTTSGSGATQRTHIFIKPIAAGVDTNAVITTDRRVYHLRLTASMRTAMTGLAWSYPAEGLIAHEKPVARPPMRAAAPAETDPARFGFGYVIRGDKPAWRPLRVFDDGRQTFVEFPPAIATGEAPPLFVLGADGDAELVNYRMRGRFYVVDRIFDVAELRLGTRRPQVVTIVRTGSVSREVGRD